MDELDDHRNNPMSTLPDESLMEWCAGGPATRYVVAAKIVNLLTRPDEKSPLSFTSAAFKLLAAAPDKLAVLKEFTKRMRPSSWSGSLATLMEANVKALDGVDLGSDAQLATFLRSEKERLGKEVKKVRQWEADRGHERDERFE
jgi:hypothetical protein